MTASPERLRLQHAALADPHRYQAYQLVAGADRPVDVAWLAARIPIHHTALRRHLDKLVAAGLLRAGPAPGPARGRPRTLFTVVPNGQPGTTATSTPTSTATSTGSTASAEADPYRLLSSLLAEAVRTGRSARDAGRSIGERVPPDGADPVDALVGEAAKLGFAPAVHDTGSEVQVTLTTCPFADMAREDPATVCQLHLGLSEGVASKLGGIEVIGLEVHDPSRARCILHLRRTAPPGASSV